MSIEITNGDLAYHLFGKASFEAGEVVQGQNNSPNALNHLWLEDATLQAGLETVYKDLLRVTLVIQGDLLFPHPYYPEASERSVYYPISTFSIYRADGAYSLIGPRDKPLLEMGAGIFPFKYDPYATDLGEYLFRSTCYPSLTQTGFDNDSVRVLGFHAGSRIGDLKLDLLLTSEINYWPLMDFSLAGLVGYKLLDFVDMGVGVNFYHLLPVDAARTTPQSVDNRIPYTGADTGKVDYYTFAGTMFDARLALDLKKIPGWFGVPTTIFGPKDLCVYGEGVVLGLEDYPSQYDTISQRIPIMFGMNIPMFRLLDVLSVEFEYWDNPHVNSMRGVWNNQLPLWPPEKNDQTEKAKWKWSVYAKKSVFSERIQLMFQIGRDHSFLPTYNNSTTIADAEEPLKQYKDFAWSMKVQFNY